ncbi:MAG: metallophosphoesterase [Verrucomicrobiota bacterium]
MPLRSWILFLLVVTTLLSIIHGFILFHLWPLIGDGPIRWITLASFVFLGTAYMIGRLLESRTPRLALPFLHIGSWWLGIMSYLFLGCFLLDLLFILSSLVPFLPVDLLPWMQSYFITLCVVVLSAMAAGHYNVLYPRVRELPIKAPGGLRIIVASDLHLCGLVSIRRVERIVNTIQSLKADLILLPGDTIDEDMTQSPRSHPFREALKKLQAPLGVIAVTGNHEWICGVNATTSWLKSCGIRVLQDEVIDLGPIYVAGRNDAASVRINGQQPIPLEKILEGVKQHKPLMVLDHQPTRISEAVEAGVDLLLCGHTHHGQFWPFQWITKKVFAISHGHKRIGSTDIYVSCGAGAWGPQVRTSSRSEILLINP